MLTFLAFGMVIVFMTLIMTRKLSPIIALILIPTAFGIIGGFAPKLGPMMLDGIRNLAPTGVMLMFAILYFGIMIDAGLFEPFVRRLVKLVHGDPVKVVMGTALLALLVSLDGDGSTTYMITVGAMLPLYKRMGIRPIILACVTMLAGGVMNILPWGGPTARAASALQVDSGQIFVPMIGPMIVGALWVLFVARALGRHERTRLAGVGSHDLANTPEIEPEPLVIADVSTHRPKLLWVNAALTALLLAALIKGVLPLPVLFMIGFAIAIMINYPSIEEQKARITCHAANCLAVVGLIFAAGIFTGILSGTKMVDAMANSVVHLVPPALGPHIAVVTAVLSVPFTFFISNDAFYFGVLPILAKAGAMYGITAAEMGRAAVMGQPVHLLSPLVPSTYLLVGLAGVEFDAHQRFTLKWAFGSVFVLIVIGVVFGVIPISR